MLDLLGWEGFLDRWFPRWLLELPYVFELRLEVLWDWVTLLLLELSWSFLELSEFFVFAMMGGRGESYPADLVVLTR